MNARIRIKSLYSYTQAELTSGRFIYMSEYDIHKFNTFEAIEAAADEAQYLRNLARRDAWIQSYEQASEAAP